VVWGSGAYSYTHFNLTTDRRYVFAFTLWSVYLLRDNPRYEARSQTMNTVGAVLSSADAYTQYLHLCMGYAVAQLVETAVSISDGVINYLIFPAAL